MVSNIGRQMPTNSFHVMRTPIAVMSVAPFSPDRDFKTSTTHRPAKPHRLSIIRRAGGGFESLEPSSPKVDCLGHIKLKRRWAKSSKNSAEKKPLRTTKGNLLSRVMKFIFGRHGREGGGQGNCGAASGGDCPTQEGRSTPYPSLGQLKRYASSSYDAKFSDIYSATHHFVDPSGSPFNGNIGGSV